jgi:16S rRNA (uracil1498-N3)-methyltransferase
MRRFFIEPDKVMGSRGLITGSEAHHLAKVLRLGVGIPIRLFDGTGRTYQSVIKNITKTGVEVTILAIDEAVRPLQPQLHLAQSLPKGKKMDLIVQKTTELGITGLHPILTENSDNRHLDGERAQHRLERWRKICREACKQSNRPQPPDCHPVVAFATFLQETLRQDFDLKLILWEKEKNMGFRQVMEGVDPFAVLILIGPEGGFSTNEIQEATAAGFQPVTVGRRILRTETAAIAVVAILQYLLGNLA